MKLVNDAHETEYETQPEVVATAPGRFHLVGEHSWFFKDKTLSMAVDLPVYVAVSRRQDSSLRFYFVQLRERKRMSLSSLKFRREDRWANAVKAVIYGYVSGGFSLGGMDVTIYSEILPSAGFGITTAVKAASAVALRRLFGIPAGDVQMLQAIERGNRIFLRAGHYSADNFAALYSRKGFLTVTDHAANTCDFIPFRFDGTQIFLVDTGVPRVSVWNEESLFEPENALVLGDLKNRKKNVYGGWQYETDVTTVNEELSVVSEDTRRKLLCVMREHGDVLEAVEAMRKGDFSRFARAVNHSYESLRDFYNLSCPEIDWILKRVCEIEPNLETVRNPVSCGRITGKGFGRCVYTVLRDCDVGKFRAKLSEYEHIFGFRPSCYEVHSADGAHITDGV